jgi:hypothetical protein
VRIGSGSQQITGRDAAPRTGVLETPDAHRLFRGSRQLGGRQYSPAAAPGERAQTGYYLPVAITVSV